LYSGFPDTPIIISNDDIIYSRIVTISNEEISEIIIHIAAASGSIEVIEFLLNDFHININTIDELGATPLIHAVSRSSLSSVKFLIERGANPNKMATECLIMEVGALSLSIYLKKWDMAEYLYPLVSNPDELDRAHIFLLEEIPLEREFNFCSLLNRMSRWE
jgi:ankyrin repeat protein